MDAFAAHRELKALLTEALTILSPSRIALATGCSLTSIENWMRRPHVHVNVRTTAHVLPRLRNWRDWVAGYVAEQDEIEELEATGMACYENRVEELKARLEAAAERRTLRDLALGCEVSDRRLLLWRVGQCIDLHLDDLARALGHLRHIDDWPADPADAVSFLNHVAQAPPADGMTRHDLI
jgi:hypothetical protein